MKSKKVMTKSVAAAQLECQQADIAMGYFEIAIAAKCTQREVHGWTLRTDWPFAARPPWRTSEVVAWARKNNVFTGKTAV